MKKIKIIPTLAHLSIAAVFLLAPMLAEAGVAPQSMSIPRFRRVFTTDQRGVQANEFRPGDVVRCVVEYDAVTSFPVKPGPYVIRWYIYEPQPGRSVYNSVIWTAAETRSARSTLERNLVAYREYRVSKPGPLFCRVSGFEGAYDPGIDVNRFPRTFASSDAGITVRGEVASPLANRPPSARIDSTPAGQVIASGRPVQSPRVQFTMVPPARVLLATPTRFVWQGGSPGLEYRYRLDVPGDWKAGIRYILNKWAPWGASQSITYSDFIVAGIYTFSVQAQDPRTGRESQVAAYRFSVYFQMPELFEEAVNIDWARARRAPTKKQQYEILAQEFKAAHLAWMQKFEYQQRLLKNTVNPKWFVETLIPVPTEEATGRLLEWADKGVALTVNRILAPQTLYNLLQVAGVDLILIFRRAETNKAASMALLTYYAWKGYDRLAQRTPVGGLPVYGDYGGPGFTGNRVPCDMMDSAFMRHDVKYGQLKALKGRLSEYELERGYLLADTELIKELTRIPEKALTQGRCPIHPVGIFVQVISALAKGPAGMGGGLKDLRDGVVAYFAAQITFRWGRLKMMEIQTTKVAPLLPSRSFWSGTIHGLQGGESFTEKAAVELMREGTTLKGRWQNSFGESGSLQGTLVGNQFNAALTISTPGCPGTGSGQGSGQISPDGRILSARWSGKTCEGSFTAQGTFTRS